MHQPLHPGEIVRELCIENTGLSIKEVALKLNIDRTTLSRLLNGHAGISADMAMRLSIALNTSIHIWLNLQRDYDAYKVGRMRSKFHVQTLVASVR